MAQALTLRIVPGPAVTIAPREPALPWRLLNRVAQFLCGLRGHQMILHFEPDRLSLECLSCGRTTPGWSLDVRPQFRLRRSSFTARPLRSVPTRLVA